MSVQKNIVTKSRLKPQLVRKRTVVKVPKTVKLIPQKRPASPPKKTKVGQGVQAQATPVRSKRQKPIRTAVVSDRIRRNKRANPRVRYLSKEPTPESKGKITKLKHSGHGRFLAIIGNGPSIGESGLDKLRGVPKIDVMSINKPDMRVWPTKFWAFFDRSQLNRHRDLWNSYAGTLFNSTAIKEQKAASMQFKNLGGRGFSRDLDKGIHIGRSSVYAALQIGLWMDYDKIFVFGCDMNPDGLNGKLHFYGTNPDVDPNIRARRFEAEASHYDVAAEILNESERKRFYFCSKSINPWPFIDKFSSIEHTAAVDQIIGWSESL
jgi:hypothetical protein